MTVSVATHTQMDRRPGLVRWSNLKSTCMIPARALRQGMKRQKANPNTEEEVVEAPKWETPEECLPTGTQPKRTYPSARLPTASLALVPPPFAEDSGTSGSTCRQLKPVRMDKREITRLGFALAFIEHDYDTLDVAAREQKVGRELRNVYAQLNGNGGIITNISALMHRKRTVDDMWHGIRRLKEQHTRDVIDAVKRLVLEVVRQSKAGHEGDVLAYAIATGRRQLNNEATLKKYLANKAKAEHATRCRDMVDMHSVWAKDLLANEPVRTDGVFILCGEDRCCICEVCSENTTRGNESLDRRVAWAQNGDLQDLGKLHYMWQYIYCKSM